MQANLRYLRYLMFKPSFPGAGLVWFGTRTVERIANLGRSMTVLHVMRQMRLSLFSCGNLFFNGRPQSRHVDRPTDEPAVDTAWLFAKRHQLVSAQGAGHDGRLHGIRNKAHRGPAWSFRPSDSPLVGM